MAGITARASRLQVTDTDQDRLQIQFARLLDTSGAGGMPASARSSALIGPQSLIITDEAGDGIGLAPGNPIIVVDAPATTVGTLNTIGDLDYYQVTLVAGKTYEIGMFGLAGGPNFFPVQDSYLELYSASGALLGSADGGASTLVNMVNSGFDAVLTFTATTSGTYYINARAFDNDPTDGTNGEGIGDYEVYAKEVNPNDPNVYHPYYDAESPLYAIDWGTQVNRVNQSVRNPDGNEGTRDTGNPQGTPTYGSGIDMAALLTANGKTLADIAGKNVITIYFAKPGDVIYSNDPTQPGLPPATLTVMNVQQFERDAVFNALQQFEKVADIVYLEVQDRAQSDFTYTSYQGTPGPGVSLLGSMSPPDESDEGLAQFNAGDYRWNALDLGQGGFSYVTLIHEFGHGHGLAHPHDNGGHSGVMNGVTADGPVADYTLGDFSLNQAVFTMMSYQDGWPESPYGNAETDVGYGYLGGLMAFDIAAIQDKYGVNESYAAGDNVYAMKDVNAVGTYYTSIWDGGGVDRIEYTGTKDAVIDLRPATLRYEAGGGGFISYAYGIFGGFTIANGVTIENATAGAGADKLFGNDVANRLDGGAGADEMRGGKGNDTYIVDSSLDRIFETSGQGSDLILTSASFSLAAGQEVETLSTAAHASTTAIDLVGNAFDQTIYGNAGTNLINGLEGKDVMAGLAGNDLYVVDNADDQVLEVVGEGNDTIFTSVSYVLVSNQEIEILSTQTHAGTQNIDLVGNQLNNILYGNNGSNLLNGGSGADQMIGFGGNDTYAIDNLNDLVVEQVGAGNDQVFVYFSYNLTNGNEVELLSTIVHAETTAINLGGNDYANQLVGNYGDNYLNGGGGADVLTGFFGNDVYVVDNAADQIVEAEDAGNDLVYSFTSYVLQAGVNAETLSAAVQAATTAINLTGNEVAQIVYGNSGANTLDGKGGGDTLVGFGGADIFAFTTALGAGNVDTIADFNAADDTIALDDAIFTALTAGGLGSGAFVTGTAAQDADDRIIYNAATGALFYDADGNGAGAAVQFATLQTGLTLTASDFSVI